MIRILRLSILFIMPLIFWGASYIFPELLKAENLKYLSTIVTILWVMCLAFFVKLDSLSNLTALDSKRLNTMNVIFRDIRKKIWWILVIGLFASVAIWIITSVKFDYDMHYFALIIGFLFGISVSYLSVIPFWFNELQSFQDNLKIREAQKNKLEATIKRLSVTNNQ